MDKRQGSGQYLRLVRQIRHATPDAIVRFNAQRRMSVSMIEVDTGQLKRAVEAQHACTATLIQSVPVKETFEDETVWEGIVHAFKIHGHPRARMAYAWSSPIEGSDKRRYFAVLHQPPVTSPGEAVRRSWRSGT